VGQGHRAGGDDTTANYESDDRETPTDVALATDCAIVLVQRKHPLWAAGAAVARGARIILRTAGKPGQRPAARRGDDFSSWGLKISR